MRGSLDGPEGIWMALSVFDDKSKTPSPERLREELGRTSGHWDDLVGYLASRYDPLDETWSYSGSKWGWALRLRQKKRTLLYMTPRRGHFLVGFALGEKAVRAARSSGLPERVLSAIAEAPKYAEGRGVRLEIRNKRDLDGVKRLAVIKMAN
jgi:hypothetical protein